MNRKTPRYAKTSLFMPDIFAHLLKYTTKNQKLFYRKSQNNIFVQINLLSHASNMSMIKLYKNLHILYQTKLYLS